MENELDTQIEKIQKEYGFVPRVNQRNEDENKAFLAMLDEYVSRIGYKLTNNVRAIDIGCRDMPYADGLITFLEKYGKREDESRQVHLVGVEGGEDFHGFEWDDLRRVIEEGKLGSTKMDLLYQWIENQKDMDYIAKGTGIEKFDVATIFAPGPDTGLAMCVAFAKLSGRQEDRKLVRYMIDGEYITEPIEKTLKPRMADDGLLIISTVWDGAPTEKILASLNKANFDILLNEENKFRNNFYGWPNHYEHIILAKKTIAKG